MAEPARDCWADWLAERRHGGDPDVRGGRVSLFEPRDLIRVAETAGFHPIELELLAEVRPVEPRSWDSFVRMSGNPPLVEEGRGTWRMASAYLRAEKS